MDLIHLLDYPATPKTDSLVLRTQAGLIESVFKQFGIPATVENIESGPTLARFSVLPGEKKRKRPDTDIQNQAIAMLKEKGYGTSQKPITKSVIQFMSKTLPQYEVQRIRVREIERLQDDLALYLDVYGVRVVPQLTGSGYVGVEVPHKERRYVGLREVITSGVWSGELPVPFGREAGGVPIVRDLAKMPHLLVAGATGTGKSVFLNSLILSILATRSSDDVRLAFIDMKQIELSGYSVTTHAIGKVASTVETSLTLLERLVTEMEKRYDALAPFKARNIVEYNAAGQHMPYIVVVIDELADLMEQAKKPVEAAILRIAQKSRAVGIHLVVATQRPSVNIITGVIKANIPTKLALTVASQTDSKVIIDQAGAEKLVSNGDALLYAPGSPVIRVQTPYVSDAEIERIVEVCKK